MAKKDFFSSLFLALALNRTVLWLTKSPKALVVASALPSRYLEDVSLFFGANAMRPLTVLALFVFFSPLCAEEKPKGALAEARQRWLKGNYAEARDLFEEQAKVENLHTAATIGISRTYLSEGEYGKALDLLDEALKKAEDDADLWAAKADIQCYCINSEHRTLKKQFPKQIGNHLLHRRNKDLLPNLIVQCTYNFEYRLLV